MGVCLIGDYTKTQASDTMISSLIDLLSWKLFKEELSAYDEFPHPNSTSPNLNSIAMHRQGCSTTCPGDSIAVRINEIRTRVQFELNKCNRVGIQEHTSKYTKPYPNPSQGEIQLHGVLDHTVFRVFNVYGILVYQGFILDQKIDISHLASGHYHMELKTANGLTQWHSIILSF